MTFKTASLRRGQFAHPTTYGEIVAIEHARSRGRIMALEKAEAAIRFIEQDLAQISKAGCLYEVGDSSMHLESYRALDRAVGDRKQWVLRITPSHSDGSGERLIAAFISLGWIIESVKLRPYYGDAILLKPMTHYRLIIDSESVYLRPVVGASETIPLPIFSRTASCPVEHAPFP